MVRFEVLDGIAVITIDRPHARNAINPEVTTGIEAAIDRVEDDPDILVAVLAGSPPTFCAGADLKSISEGKMDLLSTKRGGFAGITARHRSKPLICAIDGPALAGGVEVALSCDLIVASTAARFGLPEVKRSLVAAAGGLFRLPRHLPAVVAMEMALTGDPLSAEQAAQYGLINRLVEPGKALSAAIALGRLITPNAPLAVRASRAVVRAAIGLDDPTMWEISEQAMAAVKSSRDFLEGPRAFVEGRDPIWTGA
jgi:enoyl-CoA hydratase